MAIREASNANREARANVELLGELLGELNRAPTVNITLSPEWVHIKVVLMAALGDFPDARAAAALALQGMTHADG